MDKGQHVLATLSEEAGEVVQAVSKILRFGINDKYNGKTNKERLTEESTDLIAMLEFAHEMGLVGDYTSVEKIKAKKEKFAKWLQYSEEAGTYRKALWMNFEDFKAENI